MKRSLPIVEGSIDPRPPQPIVIRLGAEYISVSDAQDGTEARRFARLLFDHGGAEDKPGHTLPTVTIMIRSAGTSIESRLRTEALEESADFVLGSARPAFARLLAERARR